MSSIDAELAQLKEHFTAHKQEQLFRFTDTLNEEQKGQLLQQLKEIDLDQVARMYQSIMQPEKKISDEQITPFTNITDLPLASAEQKKEWLNTGLKAIGEGKVALLLMGGGQGTRLGYNLPKGLYDIGLPSHKSLLQLQAERLRRVKQLAGRLVGKTEAEVSLPWYVMTSLFTHKDTMNFFKDNNYFGLPEKDFFFFQQGMLPCLTMDGKIILEKPHAVASAPNGNGGVYEGLLKSGALDDMDKRGVSYVHAYCVDNVLVKVADPTLAGFCILSNTDCCNKVVRKRDPTEKVGVMCYRDGVAGVIEYSETPKEMCEQVDAASGNLVYGAANIANHFFTTAFVRKCATSHLPFHQAIKKIPYVDDQGQTVTPAATNGMKMEMFVFDVFPLAANLTAFATLREGEFSPLKNAPGSGQDCPETCRQDLSNFHKSLVKAAGGNIAGADEAILEISPLVSYEGEDLEPLVAGKTVDVPCQFN